MAQPRVPEPYSPTTCFYDLESYAKANGRTSFGRPMRLGHTRVVASKRDCVGKLVIVIIVFIA